MIRIDLKEAIVKYCVHDKFGLTILYVILILLN